MINIIKFILINRIIKAFKVVLPIVHYKSWVCIEATIIMYFHGILGVLQGANLLIAFQDSLVIGVKMFNVYCFFS